MATPILDENTTSEKMSDDLHSDMSSTRSISVPVNSTQLDLEKSNSRATQAPGQDAESRHPVTTAEDWDGPDDPDNPLNWSTRKKIYNTLVPAFQCFTITFGSSVYTPSTAEFAQYFNISLTAALVPVTVYIVGLGFGPMLSAPISEALGRKSVYMIFFPPSLLFTLGAGFSDSYASVVVCRFFAGFLGSGCLAVGAGTNSDMFTPLNRATASACFIIAPFLGPALGPAMGGYVAMYKGWRWTQWLVLFWGVLSYAITIFGSETYKRIILQRRAKRLSIPGPSSQLPPGMSKMHFIFMITILRPVRMLATESIVVFFSLYTAFNFSVLYAFFAAFPVIFRSPYPEIQVYHFNTGEAGLVFIGLGLGVSIGSLIFAFMDYHTYRRKTLHRRSLSDFRQLPPEERLFSAMLGGFLLPIGLFWFAWTARSDVHWISPVLATIPFGIGNMLVFCSCILYLIDAYGPLAGASAAAANGLLRYVLGAVFPLFTVQMYRAMGVAWATSLLGFVTIALMPIPWVLYKYGPTIRKRSAFAPIS